MSEITAEEFFRNKLKEVIPNKPITLWKNNLNAETAMRWAHEFAQLKLSEVKTLLKGSREQIQQKEDEISILADLVKGRDLTIKQKDEEIERLKSKLAGTDGCFHCDERNKTLAKHRELMGRMVSVLNDIKPKLVIQQNFMEAGAIRDLLTDYKNLEG